MGIFNKLRFKINAIVFLSCAILAGLYGIIYYFLKLGDVFSFSFFMFLLILGLVIIAFIYDFMLGRFIIKPLNGFISKVENIHRDNIEENNNPDETGEEDEIASLIKAFDSMSARSKNIFDKLIQERNEADAANLSKSEFLAKMSHEIRTPMNAIIGLTHLAMQTELNIRQRDYLKKIKSSSHALLGVLNDILDFSKIEAGKMELNYAEFQLEEVLETLSHLLKVQAEEKEIEILFSVAADVPRILMGDSLRLGQILINLAGNALKFTQSGEIIIGIKILDDIVLPHDRVKLLFSVKDTGIGISSEKMDDLFNAFTQADGSITRIFGGTGLGLAICKRLTEIMNGEIRAESEPGKGSIFTFSAEFGFKTEQAKKKLQMPESLRGTRVLVTDDNESSRNILRDILKSFSFEVVTAVSGLESIAILEESDKPFDLVCLDWNMPGMDGLETAGHIRYNLKLPNSPRIIMISGYGEKLADLSRDVKPDAILIKPVNRSVLLETIVETLSPENKSASGYLVEKKNIDDLLKNICGAKVLLAEDNKINQQVAREILGNAGLEVEIAENGKQAVEIAKKSDIDLILMDIQMPVMDGYEASREIRSFNTELPIIAMTANAMSGEMERCLDSGMNDYLSKPIEPETLYKGLMKWIQCKELPGKKNNAGNLNNDENSSKELYIPEILPGINTKAGLKSVAGNKELYIKILKEFAEDYSKFIDNVKLSLDKKDYAHVKMLTHTLKSVSGYMGAMNLYSAVCRLEPAVIENKFEQCTELTGMLEKELNEVFQSIDIIRDNNSTRPEKSLSSEESEHTSKILFLSSKLERLLIEGDTGAGAYLDELKRYLKDKCSKDQISLLEKQINNYDFEDAGKTLSKIIENYSHDSNSMCFPGQEDKK